MPGCLNKQESIQLRQAVARFIERAKKIEVKEWKRRSGMGFDPWNFFLIVVFFVCFGAYISCISAAVYSAPLRSTTGGSTNHAGE